MNRSATAPRGRCRCRAGAAALAISLAAAACGATPGAAHTAGHNLGGNQPNGSKPSGRHLATPLAVGQNGARPRGPATNMASTCTAPSPQAMVQGDPHMTSLPSVKSVQLVPFSGGLDVTFRLRTALVLAPAGVYISWAVYLYHHRADVARPKDAVDLQFEDRGPGWEPTGWTILASVNANATPVVGAVHIDRQRDQLTTFFPPGFTDLRPPFYWYATQEVYRAFLPEASKSNPQNWSINGSVTTDCPAGVRHDPNSLPDGAKLLSVAG